MFASPVVFVLIAFIAVISSLAAFFVIERSLSHFSSAAGAKNSGQNIQ